MNWRKLSELIACGCLSASCGAATGLRELTFQVAVPAETAPVIGGSMDVACRAKAPAHTAYYQYYVVTLRDISTGLESSIEVTLSK